MKNKIKILIAVITILAMTATVLAITLSLQSREGGPLPSETLKRAEARGIALTNLGIKADDADYATVTPEELDGKEYYVVEIEHNGLRYRYRIDASNGNIVKIYVNDEAVLTSPKPIEPDSTERFIGISEAKRIALTDAGADENFITDLETELDFSFGKYYYEIDFRINGIKYEYDVDAENGSIFKKDVDKTTVLEPKPSESDANYIGLEEAKRIALEHAATPEASTMIKSAKWDKEKGVAVYEIEFSAGGIEYEYTVNAQSGAIIYFEKEKDDDRRPSETPTQTTASSTPKPANTQAPIPTPPSTETGTTAPSINPTAPSTGNTLTMEQAKAIALAHAGLDASLVRWDDCEFEKEHGIFVYELDFKSGAYEYEYVINAETGKIIEADKEKDD